MEKITSVDSAKDTMLIAQLMGYNVIVYKGLATYDGNTIAKTVGEKQKLWEGLDLEFTGRHCKDVSYPFATDWNYLMPILSRIESLGFNSKIDTNHTWIFSTKNANQYKSVLVGGNSKKENTYKAILQFADWYLKQQKKGS